MHYQSYPAQPGYPAAPQQQQQQQTVVVIQQPTSTMNTGGQPQNVRDWSTGLCDCCDDCCICACAFFFPWCYRCWLASDLNENACGALCWQDAFAPAMRTKVRTMYGIKGSICEDVCCVVCCGLCALTQTHRELKNSGFAR